jgi:hypothetical protein
MVSLSIQDLVRRFGVPNCDRLWSATPADPLSPVPLIPPEQHARDINAGPHAQLVSQP